MALVYGTKLQGKASTNPVVLSFTCPANTRVLVIGLAVGSLTVRSGTPTYNGIAMTLAYARQQAATEVAAEMWYLPNPPTGAAYNISVPNSGLLSVEIIASCYTSTIADSAALDVANGQVGTVLNPSTSVTTTADGDAIVDVMANSLNTAETGRDRTLLYATDEGTWNSAAQYTLQATHATIAFSHTIAAANWGHIVAAFKEIIVTPKAASDAGAGSEIHTNTSPTVVRAISDVGTGGDVSSKPGVTQNKVDAGVASETKTLAATNYTSDGATTAEVSSLLKSYAVVDAGTASESKSVQVSQTTSDVATGTEAKILQTASAHSDSAAGSDQANLQAATTKLDTGVGSESRSLIAIQGRNDAGSCSEYTILQATNQAVDGGAAAEVSHTTVELAQNDTSAATEVASWTTQILVLGWGQAFEVSDLDTGGSGSEKEVYDAAITFERATLFTFRSTVDTIVATDVSYPLNLLVTERQAVVSVDYFAEREVF